ncbi:anti-sigma-28 factor, FlgM family [Pseudomonas sp. ok272]|uniref:flagellar biosynthesis anti-sigma factor FlgM n=2 Tax=unclassified Pseudomonas TaxID=196821 RepID=UPI0008C47D5E|nr:MULTISPECIES: flagellar biosynthesis anti-sigma factor FlgM [unclassified Pseudomonas]SEM63213.1 anti-sigma-28 factor, FlgM family [Pseudomonas sp. ok272]SFM46824.1 anti-sigma-28 factor, FlgM family [Pseudomonas sp. ok602]
MEISRPFKAGFNVPSETSALSNAERPGPSAAASMTARSPAPRLEHVQDALRSLPDIDLDKVAAFKLALQRGEISTDTAALASSMLSYHSGSDV